MNAFSAALDALFEDANMAADAIYKPNWGPVVVIRVIRTAPDVTRDMYGSAITSETVVYEIRMSDVASPQAGDTISYDGEDRIVQGQPERDDQRTIWLLDTVPA
ncbi:head-tail joining protein [Mameliella sp.]|uniref:head-tail joining protein n=1 Tax=Mameliella sp. TaxID=1924940 RepID=UPI003BAAB731